MGVYIKYQSKDFYVDNFADMPHDHHYTTSAWNSTLNYLQAMKQISLKNSDIKKVIVWSDGGLKTKENLDFFLEIKRIRSQC